MKRRGSDDATALAEALNYEHGYGALPERSTTRVLAHGCERADREALLGADTIRKILCMMTGISIQCTARRTIFELFRRTIKLPSTPGLFYALSRLAGDGGRSSRLMENSPEWTASETTGAQVCTCEHGMHTSEANDDEPPRCQCVRLQLAERPRPRSQHKIAPDANEVRQRVSLAATA
jgi:hypothetical protein